MRRWPQCPELREQGEPGFLGDSASVLGCPSHLVSTHSAPIASASVPLMLHRTLTLRLRAPNPRLSRSCLQQIPQLRPHSFVLHPKSEDSRETAGWCSSSPNRSRSPYLQHHLSGMNFFVAPFPSCHVFLALVQGLFVDSRSKDPGRDLLPTTSSVFGRGVGGGSIGSLKGGGGSWGSWGCNKPGTPSLASSYPASSYRTARGREIGGR